MAKVLTMSVPRQLSQQYKNLTSTMYGVNINLITPGLYTKLYQYFIQKLSKEKIIYPPTSPHKINLHFCG